MLRRCIHSTFYLFQFHCQNGVLLSVAYNTLSKFLQQDNIWHKKLKAKIVVICWEVVAVCVKVTNAAAVNSSYLIVRWAKVWSVVQPQMLMCCPFLKMPCLFAFHKKIRCSFLMVEEVCLVINTVLESVALLSKFKDQRLVIKWHL